MITATQLHEYAVCPRRYKYKYIEQAPHYLTYRELFAMCHRKAFHYLMNELHDGRRPSSDDYYGVWESEWNSKRHAVGLWHINAQETYPIKAKKQSKYIADDIDWVPPERVDFMMPCTLGIPNGPEIHVHVDWCFKNAYGILVFLFDSQSRSQILKSMRATALQSIDKEQDIRIIAVTSYQRFSNIWNVRQNIWSRHKRPVIAAMLDMLRAIEAGSFPRCNPATRTCSDRLCGYWVSCTKLRPGLPLYERARHYNEDYEERHDSSD